MGNKSENYNRIAKNTAMLYLRMLLVMGVSLYTVKAMLGALGEEDYGINNVVGGIIVMLSFLTQVLSSASHRFFSFSIGQQDFSKVSRIFSVMLILYGIMCLFILFLSETAGLWFLNYKMTIPEDRMFAANIVFQFSILSFCWKIFTAPHCALILAHEKMNIYAYVGMAEVVLRLVVVILVQYYDEDKLIFYAIVHFLAIFSVNAIYIFYSRFQFRNIRFKFDWDREITSNVVSYSGWTLFGMLAVVARSQGINMVLNVFFGPIVNAARGIAYNVNGSVISVTSNFYTAVKPQIVKYYAAGDLDSCFKLIARSTKFSYYLVLLLVVPIIVYTPEILHLWLGKYPDYTVTFTRLILITAVIDSMANPITTFNQATGKIKWFQIVVGVLLILNVPLTVLVFVLGSEPYAAFFVSICVSILAMAARLVISAREHDFPLIRYLRSVTSNLMVVTILGSLCAYLYQFIEFDTRNISGLFMNIFVIIIMVLFLSLFVGFDKPERNYAVNMVKSRICKK